MTLTSVKSSTLDWELVFHQLDEPAVGVAHVYGPRPDWWCTYLSEKYEFVSWDYEKKQHMEK